VDEENTVPLSAGRRSWKEGGFSTHADKKRAWELRKESKEEKRWRREGWKSASMIRLMQDWGKKKVQAGFAGVRKTENQKPIGNLREIEDNNRRGGEGGGAGRDKHVIPWHIQKSET